MEGGGPARPAAAQPRTARGCSFGPRLAPLNTQLCPVIVEHCVYSFPTFPVSFFWDQNDLRQRQPTRMGNCAAELQVKQKCYAKKQELASRSYSMGCLREGGGGKPLEDKARTHCLHSWPERCRCSQLPQGGPGRDQKSLERIF